MIYSRKNYEQAKYLIGKKVICWSDKDIDKSNVYEATLVSISNSSFYFVIDKETQVLKEERVKNCSYKKSKMYNCFEFIKPYDIDDDKNYLLDFG